MRMDTDHQSEPRTDAISVNDLASEALNHPDVKKLISENQRCADEIRRAAKELANTESMRREDMIPALKKTADAIINGVRVFVSYKKKEAENARKLVRCLREISSGKLDIFFAEEIRHGEDWTDVLFDKVINAHWFLLLLPDPAEELDWPLYEAGMFRVRMLPGDRLICLHHPDAPLAPQLEDYQAVEATEARLTHFLQDILTKPGAVPGMEPINEYAEDAIPEMARKIKNLVQPPSGSEIIYFDRFVAIQIDDPAKVANPEYLNAARIVKSQGTEEIFDRLGSDQTWGELVSNLNPKVHATEWLFELSAAIQKVVRGSGFPPIQSTFHGLRGGKEYRPHLHAIQRNKNRVIETFHISFTEELGRGQTASEPRGLRALAAALRLAYRFRWEVIEPYRNQRLFDEERIKAIRQTLERMEKEARLYGDLDRDLLISQFDGDEATRLDKMYDEWERMRNGSNGTLDRAFAEKNSVFLKEALDALAELNKEFMTMASKRYAELVAEKWQEKWNRW